MRAAVQILTRPRAEGVNLVQLYLAGLLFQEHAAGKLRALARVRALSAEETDTLAAHVRAAAVYRAALARRGLS